MRPVWVDLERLLAHPADTPNRVAGDGLDLTGEAPGFVQDWIRSDKGMWLAVTSYAVRYVDGRPRPYQADRQLLPLYAVRPREVTVAVGTIDHQLIATGARSSDHDAQLCVSLLMSCTRRSG